MRSILSWLEIPTAPAPYLSTLMKLRESLPNFQMMKEALKKLELLLGPLEKRRNTKVQGHASVPIWRLLDEIKSKGAKSSGVIHSTGQNVSEEGQDCREDARKALSNVRSGMMHARQLLGQLQEKLGKLHSITQLDLDGDLCRQCSRLLQKIELRLEEVLVLKTKLEVSQERAGVQGGASSKRKHPEPDAPPAAAATCIASSIGTEGRITASGKQERQISVQVRDSAACWPNKACL